MTEFQAPIKTLQIVDPRMRINQERVQAIAIGPVSNSYRVVAADSSLAVSSVNFTYNATSVKDIIDRHFYVRYFLQVDITGTGSPLTAYGVSDSLRFLPINSSCTSLQLTINNAKVSVDPFQWLDGISRYIKVSDLKNDLSASPSTPDLMFDYSAASGPKNVMGSFTDNSLNSPDLRGSIVPFTSSEGNGVSQFQIEIVEPLFITPLTYQDRNVPGLTGVESLSLNLSHDWSGGNTWSHAGGTTLDTFAFTMYRTPQLLVNVLGPNRLVEPYNPLRTYVYNNVSMRHYTTAVGVIVAGESQIVSSGNIQMNTIPSRIYVFARKRKVDRVSTDSDTFAVIESISVALGNDTGLLANSTQRDLYKISVSNGYQYSFNTWKHFQGSVLCLKPSADLSLALGEAPGLVAQKQLVVTVNLTNQTANDQNYELIIVPVLPGSFMIINGQASQSVGLLDPSQILTSPIAASDIEFAQHENLDVYGSGLFDFLRKAFKLALPVIAPLAGDLALKGVDALSKLLRKKIKKKTGRGKGLMIEDISRDEFLGDISDDDEIDDEIEDEDEVFEPFVDI